MSFHSLLFELRQKLPSPAQAQHWHYYRSSHLTKPFLSLAPKCCCVHTRLRNLNWQLVVTQSQTAVQISLRFKAISFNYIVVPNTMACGSILSLQQIKIQDTNTKHKLIPPHKQLLKIFGKYSLTEIIYSVIC